MKRADKFPHEIPGKHDHSKQLCIYGGMNAYDPGCNGGARGRANSSATAAIVMDVTRSSTVRSTKY